MPADYVIFMALGGFFAFIGIILLVWGKREEQRYYSAIGTRIDVREFLEHTPKRPEPGALKTGGWIAIAVGLILLGLGGAVLKGLLIL